MQARKAKLRFELQHYILQVLEERQEVKSPSIAKIDDVNAKRLEYARALQRQIEESRQREKLSNEQTSFIEEPAWFEVRERVQYPSREEQKQILLEQIEVSRQKRAAENKLELEEDVLWEHSYDRQLRNTANLDTGTIPDFLTRNRRDIHEIEQQIHLLSDKLHELQIAQQRAEKIMINNVLSSNETSYEEDIEEGSQMDDCNSTSKKLEMTARYFVYVAKPGPILTPPATPPLPIPQQIEQKVDNVRKFEEDDSSDSDEDERTSEAARHALQRAAFSSDEDEQRPKDFRTDLSINSFIEGEIPIGTPHSKFSTSSFGS